MDIIITLMITTIKLRNQPKREKSSQDLSRIQLVLSQLNPNKIKIKIKLHKIIHQDLDIIFVFYIF